VKCPFCAHTSDRVVDSREVHDGSVIRRRRECLECERRFTSYERIEQIPYMIVKQDGRRERFDRQKLLSGLLRACEKRPVSMKVLDRVVDGVETLLQERVDREMTAREVGNFVVDRLRDLDQVAYVRFASVYRRFEDVEEFRGALQELSDSPHSDRPRRGRRKETEATD